MIPFHSWSTLFCRSEGKSRSVTLVLAYLMLTQRWSLKQALNHVR